MPHVVIDDASTIAILSATGTKSSSGDTTVIDAPDTGEQIAIVGMQLQNQGASVVTATIKHGSNAAAQVKLFTGLLPWSTPAFGGAWMVGDAQPLIITLDSGLSTVNYTIWYYIA